MNIDLRKLPSPCPLNLNQIRVLAACMESGQLGVGATEMAEMLGISATSGTHVFDRLEILQYARRYRGGNNRRKRPLIITVRGREFMEKFQAE